MAEEFSYEITEKYGVLSTSKSGWTMEFNAVSWNGRDPKFDIRSWSPDHEKMGKGITLTKEEVAALKELLAKVKVS
ncbi:MAG: YdbC family protein [Treponema sp.]